MRMNNQKRKKKKLTEFSILKSKIFNGNKFDNNIQPRNCRPFDNDSARSLVASQVLIGKL
ncbi:hypothetical protein DERP_002140 [Dermatophagoides pteronyssinus]|uniref:Uncharacterized protein n=1 Tax=Dermatophagoides pteronyssinus TaxID=6956 RepID=A0ABQ8JGV7_DERPT|nr:hypothetical protein DERP_002140 [Dermatophagoides pteronyssinus]